MRNKDNNMEVIAVNYILIKPDKEILMQKRDNTEGIKEPGKWCFPGGHLEKGEDILEAVVRELKEETDVNLPKEKFEFLCDSHAFDGDISKVFVCNVSDDINVVCNEGEKMEWKTLNEIKEMELAGDQADITPFLEKYINK